MTLVEYRPEPEIIPPGPTIDYWPHPITSEDRCEVYAAEGQTLEEVFEGRIPPGTDAHAVVNGALVAQSEWHSVVLRRDDVVQVRVRVGRGGGGGSNPIAVILSIAVIVAAPYLAAALAPALGIATTAGIALLSAGIQFAGLLIVNALFPPRLPDPPSLEGQGQPPPQYSLSGGSNRLRRHEPLLMLLGAHRMYPDVVASEYTEYDDNSEQFLNGIYDFGIGNLDIGPPRFGETPFANFASIAQQKQVNAVTLVAGNVDTISGGEFEAAYPNGRMNGSPWVTRRTAGNTTSIGFDLVSMHFAAQNDGSLDGRTAFFRVEWKKTSATTWTHKNVDIVSPDGADARNAVRRTVSTGRITAAAYDVRVKIRASYDDDDDLSRITYRAAVPTIKAHQDETADFTGRNPLAVRAKATGQLYGRLDRVNADVAAKYSNWDGTDWNTTEATSNPAAVLLWWLRGYRVANKLRAGYGLSNDQIDFTSLQRWHAFCEDQGLECNVVVSDTRNEDEIAMLICQCGWARLDISTGKYGVVYEDANRPVTAIVNPANIVAGSVSVSYDNENLADEIIGQYLDAASDYQENTLRRPVPQFTITGEFPVTIRLEGVTNGEQAAKEINRTAAAQYYHQRQIVWEMDDEGRTIGIGDVLGMANGLIGNGQGGRLLSISENRRVVGTAFEVESASGTAWVWQLDDTVRSTTYTRSGTREVTLAAALSSPVEGVLDHPTAYRIMLFAATDPYTKVRVTGIDATGPHRFRFTARDELQQYYDFRTSDLTAPLIPIGFARRPAPTGFVVTETDLGERVYTWNEPDAPVVGYQIRYGTAGTAFEDMKDIHEGLLPGSPWTSLERPGEGTWRFGLVAVYDDGRRSSPVYAQSTLSVGARLTQYAEVEIYRVLAVGADAPERPGAGAGSYNFTTKTLTPPEDWVGPAFPTFTRSQVVYACTATADTAEGPVWSPDADDWVGPYIVGDENDLDIIYRRYTVAPTTAPAASAGVPENWFTNVSDVPEGPGLIYVAIGHRPRGTSLYTWQLPTQLEGQDATSYRELEAYKVVAASAAAPANPGTTAEGATHDWGSYNFSTGVFTPPTGWTGPSFPSYGRNQVVYAVTATADSASGSIWNAGSSSWKPTTPVVVGNADDLDIIYRRFAAAPTAAPAASVSAVPSGTGLIYQSIGHRQRGARLYTWQLPTQLQIRTITGVARNGDTGVVTLTYSDGTTDTFTIEDGTDAAALTATFTTDAAGDVTVTLSDGTTFEIPAGRAGRGIKSIVRNTTTGVVTVTYDDNDTDTFNVVDGRDGVGITSISRSATTGVVTFTYTDGTTDTFTVNDGADGASISTRFTTNAAGDVTVTFSDGTSFTIPAGEDGTNGRNGRGIRSLVRNRARTTVVVTYDDGTTASFPLTDGEDGEDGDPVSRSGLFDQISIGYNTQVRAFAVRDVTWSDARTGPNGEKRGSLTIYRRTGGNGP